MAQKPPDMFADADFMKALSVESDKKNEKTRKEIARLEALGSTDPMDVMWLSEMKAELAFGELMSTGLFKKGKVE